MKTRRILIIVSALLLVALISGVVSTIVVATWPFTDITPGHWAYNSIKWLYDNNITTGYTADNTYRPNNNVRRDEMAAFLHRQAGILVAAGVKVEYQGDSRWEITQWFNNVNGQEPTHFWFVFHNINFGFDMSDKFVQCTVYAKSYASDGTQICSASTGDTNVWVTVYDLKGESPTLGDAGFWLLVYGHDIQP